MLESGQGLGGGVRGTGSRWEGGMSPPTHPYPCHSGKCGRLGPGPGLGGTAGVWSLGRGGRLNRYLYYRKAPLPTSVRQALIYSIS